MADNKVSVELTIEEQEALKSISNVSKKLDEFSNDASKAGKKVDGVFSGLGSTFEKAFKVETAADFFAVFNLATKAAGYVKDLAGEVINLALAGEQIKAIRNEFELIANQSGLSASAIENGIVRALDGVADTEDALKVATQSLISLGQNGEKIPEIFELARKAANVFGGDAITRFEQISNAIESGNVKGLKQVGIIINVKQAYDDMAASVGVTADQLTTAEKQQAILNATLQKGGEAFKNINVNSRELEESGKKLKVSFGELGDSLATLFFNVFGPGIKSAAKETALFLDSLNRGLRQLNGETIGADEKVKVLTEDLERLTALRERQNQPDKTLDEQIAKIEQQIRLQEKLQAIESGGTGETPLSEDVNAIKLAQRQALADGERAIDAQVDQEQIERDQRLLEQRRAFNAELASINEQARIAEAEKRRIEDQTFLEGLVVSNMAELEQRQANQTAILNAQNAAELAKVQAMEKGAKRDQELTRVTAQNNLKVKQQETQQLAEQQKLRQQNFRDSLNSIATLQQSSSKELFAIGKAAAVAQATIDGIQAVQKALASAPPPFNFAIAALVGAAQAANLAKIASAKPPGFADGGIVGGTSFAGDRVAARVNSGEMILNRQQQANLFDIANGGGGSVDFVAAIDRLGDRISRMNIVVQANAREIARLVRDEREAGFAV